MSLLCQDGGCRGIFCPLADPGMHPTHLEGAGKDISLYLE